MLEYERNAAVAAPEPAATTTKKDWNQKAQFVKW